MILLLKSLSAESILGRDHNLANVTDLSSWKKSFPVCTKKEYLPYFERIEKGETNVLICGEVLHYNESTGTTGLLKKVPNPRIHSERTTGVIRTSAVRHSYLNGLFDTSKTMYLLSFPATEEDVDISLLDPSARDDFIKPVPAHTDSMFNRLLDRALKLVVAHPTKTMRFIDYDIGHYVTALFALQETNVTAIYGAFVYQALAMLKLLCDRHEDIIEDIRKGDINSSIYKEAPAYTPLLDSLKKQLKPNPTRAAELRSIFKRFLSKPPAERDIVLAKALWPTLKVIVGIAGGPSTVYESFMIGEKIISTEIAVYSPSYGCVECTIGINICNNLNDRAYLPDLEACSLELIPVREDGSYFTDHPQPVDLWDTDIGAYYEVVTTGLTGVYRYVLGDIVRTSHRVGQIPTIEFCYRKAERASVGSVYVPDMHIYNAIVANEQQFGFNLFEYTSYCALSSGSEKPSLEVFIEITSRKREQPDLTQLATAVEKQLSQISESYNRALHDRKEIGHLRIHIVKPNTFISVRQFMMRFAPPEFTREFKMPRLVHVDPSYDARTLGKFRTMLQMLSDNTTLTVNANQSTRDA